MEINYSDDIVRIIRTYLCEEGCNHSFDKKRGTFRFDVGFQGNIRNLQYLITVHAHDYNVYAIYPVSVDEEDETQMRQIMEYICRANYNLRAGNFELDVDDGEIRFKTYVDYKGAELAREIIEKSIHIPALMFLRYGKGILQVIFNHIPAKDAISMAEDDDIPTLFSEDRSEDEDDTESEEPKESEDLAEKEARMARIVEFLQALQNENEENRDNSEETED